jgi:glycolate oxidase iron-sulfur subunit
MSTCPSGVNYMHLIDHARAYIERRYRRPLSERLFRGLLASVLPYPARFRLALRLARLARPMTPLIEKVASLKPIAAMLALAPDTLAPKPSDRSSPATQSLARVAIVQGCAEPVLKPEIRAATLRLLNRIGCDVIFARGEVCCGALVQHMGREEASLEAARRNVDAWIREIEGNGLDAIIITASGCGTTIKNYGFMLREDATYAEKAARVSALAKDVCEFIASRPLPEGAARDLTVAYHAACSLQHGQKVTDAPMKLLAHVGYRVRTPTEAHLCCGSAGTYNILQPDLARQLRDRKLTNIERLQPDVIATGNIGCAMQIANGTRVPVVHTVELLDWATGGPVPPTLSDSNWR